MSKNEKGYIEKITALEELAATYKYLADLTLSNSKHLESEVNRLTREKEELQSATRFIWN